jgi:hypothetical protein
LENDEDFINERDLDKTNWDQHRTTALGAIGAGQWHCVFLFLDLES